MIKYICTACGYIHNSEKGDHENDIQPGTPFEALSDNPDCRDCGAQKSMGTEEGFSYKEHGVR